MKFEDREFSLYLGIDPETDSPCLELFEGTMPLGAPAAACFYSDALGEISLVPYEDDVPAAAMEWLRVQTPRLLPPPGAVMESGATLYEGERAVWFYVLGAAMMLAEVWFQARHGTAHALSTGLRVVSAGTFLAVALAQHRSTRATAAFGRRPSTSAPD